MGPNASVFTALGTSQAEAPIMPFENLSFCRGSEKGCKPPLYDSDPTQEQETPSEQFVKPNSKSP